MSASAPIGEYARIVAERDMVLANVSPATRRKLLGRPCFFRPVAKTHRIVVNCKTKERTVEGAAPPPSAAVVNPFRPRSSKSAILYAVAEAWGVEVADLRSPSRCREIAWPRFAAMSFLQQLGWTTTRIGKLFSGRDHSSVVHGLQRAKGLRRDFPNYRHRYEAAHIALAGGVC